MPCLYLCGFGCTGASPDISLSRIDAMWQRGYRRNKGNAICTARSHANRLPESLLNLCSADIL